MYSSFIDDIMEKGTFIEDSTLIEEFDNHVKYWHAHETNKSLSEFLGLSTYEYEQWLKEGNSVLMDVIYCRRNNIELKNYNRNR